MSTTQYPLRQGGHLIRPHTPSRGAQQEWACDDCGTVGPFGLFSIIGQRDFCPARVDSMNGYIWFNADDPSVARTRASHQWRTHAEGCGYTLVNYTEVTDTPGVCARFTWHEQPYVLRYGKDTARGMKANDLRVERAHQNPEPDRCAS